MPYFLQQRIRGVGLLENEYGRILLEEGLPGLFLWVGFILWLAIRGAVTGSGPWAFGRRMAWVVVIAYFSTAVIGLGLMASIPQSYVFFLLAGWIAVPERSAVPVAHAISLPPPGGPIPLRAL
jgi:hypothetical protein